MFPNGRWADLRSPAVWCPRDIRRSTPPVSKTKAIDLWGEPTTPAELGALIANYLGGKVKSSPWSDTPVSAEIDEIKSNLVTL